MKLTLVRDGGTRGQRDAQKFIRGLRLNCAQAAQRVWNRRGHSRDRLRQLAFLHQQPQHGPHNQGDQNSSGEILRNPHNRPPFYPRV
jgi:hypothetical protein